MYNDVRRVDRNGIITTIVGVPNGFMSTGGDNVPALNQPIQRPHNIVADHSGNLYFADSSAGRVYKIDSAGILHTIFGMLGGTFWGDGGPAKLAGLNGPCCATADRDGNVFFVDRNRIRKVDTLGIISTYAGTGTTGSSGDGGQPCAPNSITPTRSPSIPPEVSTSEPLIASAR